MSKRDAKDQTDVDAFTAEVIRSALVAITGEMKTNLMRTAYHTIIYEAEDFTVGLFDADGNTISIGLGLPMFIRGLSDAIKAKIAHWGKENIEPGDILLTNDSYTMGSHLNHLIFTLPIFHNGELMAFSSSMAHWQDVGGQLGGVTRDIFSEGLQLPFVKSFRAGKENLEITSIIKANVRVPERDFVVVPPFARDLRAHVRLLALRVTLLFVCWAIREASFLSLGPWRLPWRGCGNPAKCTKHGLGSL